jgi:TRAP-type C4-dicarboxylate transport system permease small subunit
MTAFSPRNILSAWYRLEEAVLSLLLMAMIILACLQISMRFFFSSGIVWIDPILRYLVLWSGLLGAAVATRMSKHIAIDLITHLVSDHISHWLTALVQLFSLIICSILTYASVIFVINEASFDSSQLLLGLSSWQLNLIFPISFGLMSLHFLISMFSGLGKRLKSSTT